MFDTRGVHFGGVAQKNRVCVNVRTCAFEALAIAQVPEGGDV
jgi:hypothetical protein